jgi:hypothetical protein
MKPCANQRRVQQSTNAPLADANGKSRFLFGKSVLN